MNKILVIAIMAGILVVMTIAGVLIHLEGALAPDFLFVIPQAYRYALIVAICFLCLLVSEMAFSRKMRAVLPTRSLTEKLGVVRSAIIIRTAILEIAAFTVVVCALMWGDQNLNLISLAVIAAILFRFPTAARIAAALNLNRQERQELGIHHPL